MAEPLADDEDGSAHTELKNRMLEGGAVLIFDQPPNQPTVPLDLFFALVDQAELLATE